MTTAVRDQRLLEALRTTPSATKALADHLGLTHLVLDRQHSDTNHRLTARERDILKPAPGVVYGYHRDGFLRAPTGRPVAWVTATVLTSRLPRTTAGHVLDANVPLGGLLLSAGGVRRPLDVRHEQRADYSGELIFMVSRAAFDLDGQPVAVVTEQVYDWVARG